MSARQIEAARALLAARDRLLAAELAETAARTDYIEAEEAYLKAGPEGSSDDHPGNALVDGIVIMPVDEWWDAKRGSRLTYHTIKVTA